MSAAGAAHPPAPGLGNHRPGAQAPWARLRQTLVGICLSLALLFSAPQVDAAVLGAWFPSPKADSPAAKTDSPASPFDKLKPLLKPSAPSGVLQEVPPPVAVQQIQQALADRQPRLTIGAPANGADLPGGSWTLKLTVQDWPLADGGPLGIGPHVVVQIDDQAPIRITEHRSSPKGELVQLTLPALAPGSHRVTAYAAMPWGEALRNPGAASQIRVHRVAANPVSLPQAGSPQLLNVRPLGPGGGEPLLLDWLLLDAPLQHLRENDGRWRLRITINGERFVVDQDVPLWLKGWKTGSNSLQLDLLDGRGKPLNPPFNSLVSEVVLQVGTSQPRWLKGEFSAEELATLLGQTPAPGPTAKATPQAAPIPKAAPSQLAAPQTSRPALKPAAPLPPTAPLPASTQLQKPSQPEPGPGPEGDLLAPERPAAAEGPVAADPYPQGAPAAIQPRADAYSTAEQIPAEQIPQDQGLPDQIAPDQIAPDQILSDQSLSDQNQNEDLGAEDLEPKDLEPENLATEELATEDMAAEKPNPEKPNPENLNPQKLNPEKPDTETFEPLNPGPPNSEPQEFSRQGFSTQESAPGELPAEDSPPQDPAPEGLAPAELPPATPPPSEAGQILVSPKPIANPDRLSPSSSMNGSARENVREDGSLIKPKRQGPLAGLRQRLGA